LAAARWFVIEQDRKGSLPQLTPRCCGGLEVVVASIEAMLGRLA